MSGFWEIEASVSPAREILVGGCSSSCSSACRSSTSTTLTPRPTRSSICAPRSARRLALEILAAADDADWQTEQNGCPEQAR